MRQIYFVIYWRYNGSYYFCKQDVNNVENTVIYQRHLKTESRWEIFANDKALANIAKIFRKRIKVGLKYISNNNPTTKTKHTCSSSLYFHALAEKCLWNTTQTTHSQKWNGTLFSNTNNLVTWVSKWPENEQGLSLRCKRTLILCHEAITGMGWTAVALGVGMVLLTSAWEIPPTR